MFQAQVQWLTDPSADVLNSFKYLLLLLRNLRDELNIHEEILEVLNIWIFQMFYDYFAF